MSMKIVIGNDHTAVELKNHIKVYLEERGYEVCDVGADSTERVDYPLYGERAARKVAAGECSLGVLICGTGIGISLAANKVRGIRAAVCSEPYSARLSRQHNNANMIAFGSRVVGTAMAEMILDEFLAAQYEGGRHEARVRMIAAIEQGDTLCTESV